MMEKTKDVGLVLLAGGSGMRMRSNTPKQFMMIDDKPMVLHSLDLFASIDSLVEIVVVCAEEYRPLFSSFKTNVKLSFAQPGARRQDSAYNGLMAMDSKPRYICIHDAARPYISLELVKRTIDAARECGAAACAMPLKFTVKQVDSKGMVIATPDRSTLWEIQTPQVIERSLLQKGFDYAYQNDLTVTDDLSLVENLGIPAKIVEGCYSNIKITTPEDLL